MITWIFTTPYYQQTKLATPINSRIKLALLVTLLGFASSCRNDDDSNLGLGVQPPSDNINTIIADSFTVIMTTVTEDSLRSDVLSANPIGNYFDPIFGQTEARLFTELRLPEAPVDFSGATIDSVVFTMRYSTNSAQYGNKNSSQTFTLYQLTENISESEYFTNDSIKYNASNPLGSVTDVFNTTDSIEVGRGSAGKVKWGAHLRIKVDNQTFINTLKDAPASVYGDEEAFRTFFKGLAIIPTGRSGNGVITTFDILAGISNMTVYYNGDSYRDFLINEDARRVTSYKHDKDGLPDYIKAQLANPSIDHDTTYIQAMGRLKTKITFPYLLDVVKDGNIGLVGAELEFFVDQSKVDDDYAAPSRLLVVQPDLEGRNASIPLVDLNREKGSYNSTTGSYKFSVTSHLQSIFNDWLSNKENNNRGLYIIIPTENPNTPSRVVIDASKTKLKLFYNRVK